MHNQLQLTLLGTPEVRRNGALVSGFRSSKTQALLYYLALTARLHTRATLAGLWWGDQPEVGARANLNKCLSNLREIVGNALLIERQSVAFNRDHPHRLDTEQFTAGIRTRLTPETAPALQATLALYRGDLLEGFYVRDAPDFEQWLLTQRAHYREAAITGLQALAHFYAQQGELSDAISHTRRLLMLEPWREEAHRQLMTLLAHSGQRAAALAQFEACRQILDEELAVAPDAETVALFEKIKRNDFTGREAAQSTPIALPAAPVPPQPDRPVTHNLPIPTSSLIGRERESAEVQGLLTTPARTYRAVNGQASRELPATKLVTLTGAGGSGKTRLALQVATNLLPSYQDGVWWVDLAALVDDHNLMPHVVAKALGVRETPNQPLPETLADHLLAKQALLVLDNCERLIDACAQLAHRLISHCPGLQILTTSREPLGISGERIYQVPTLELPALHTSRSPEFLLRYAAIQLFVERSQAMDRSFALTSENAAAVWKICHKLDGIPLAIELAAARVRVLSVDQIAARLSDRLHLLTTGSRAASPHHQTLRATLDWSYDLLTNDERLLFRRLAVFAGSFPLEASEEVCGPLSLPVFDGLAHLVDKSLVTVEQTDQGMYYRLLDTVREYARGKLLASGEIEQLRKSHLNFFIRVAETMYEQIHYMRQERWLAQFEQLHDNIRIALRRATESSKILEALRLAGAMGTFWTVRGYWREGSAWLEQALALRHQVAAPSSALELDGWSALALRRAGELRWQQCDFTGARSYLEESLTLYRKLGDQRNSADIIGQLGGLAFEQADHEAARKFYEESLAIGRMLENQHWIGIAFFGLGLVAYHQGDYAEAQLHLTESLALLRVLEHKQTTSYPLNALGNLANLRGNYATARTFYEECLTLRRELGYKRGVAATLNDLANVTAKQGDTTTARALYWESLEGFRELGNPRGMVWVLSGLARLCQGQGQHQRAVQLLAAVDTLLKAMNARLDEPEYSDSAQAIALLRTQLDESTFNYAWNQGQHLRIEQAITLAQQGESTNI